MVIQCTKELLKNMKREPEPIPDGESMNPLYTWNATIYRKISFGWAGTA